MLMLGQGQTSWIREMDLSWGLLGWLVLVRASIMDSEEVGEIVFVKDNCASLPGSHS